MKIEHPESSIQHLANRPTFVVELTPAGRGAVAVVLVAGARAVEVVAKYFVPRGTWAVAEIPVGRIALGRWGGDGGEELIFCRRGDEQIEIHCHGGDAAVRSVVSGLVKAGCETLSWQDWASRCSSDSISAAALVAIADAPTERTAAILLDQLNGKLAQAIHDIVEQISAANWSAAGEAIDQLCRRREIGLHLTKPWRVAVCGAPNVGKSSLINALAGYERAIVSPTPGTTRDVVTITTALGGWPVQLADTAGFRTTEDELESAGIALAAATLAGADLAIALHDATCLDDESNDVRALFTGLLAKLPERVIHVINKVDLVPMAARSGLQTGLNGKRPDARDVVLVSARTGEGIADLASAIQRVLVAETPPAGAAVPFTVEQFDCLVVAREAVARRDAGAAIAALQALLGGE